MNLVLVYTIVFSAVAFWSFVFVRTVYVGRYRMRVLDDKSRKPWECLAEYNSLPPYEVMVGQFWKWRWPN